ncbi:C4-dicarboxylate TRAP transporter substrate-binding protein [Azospirillum sp. ST 5-10]|uniref:C4-dicarboxylate TRAP transporter substrate-binding protein n=1 Tax=unclassified Azospirillum TaxID=2630922 RepID=UPI003F49F4E7
MNRIVSCLALAGGLVLASAATAPAKETLRLTIASGHPEVFLWVKHMKESFIPTVKAELAKTGEVEIEWTEAYGGTLVKLGSEAEAMRSGIVDVAMASGVFSPAELGILNITYAMPFGPTDPELVAAAVEGALVATDGLLDQVADATGVVYVGGGVVIDGYNIAATRPVHGRADLKGLKIGGAGPNLAWLDGTGAVGVQGSYVTFYNDIKTGVYDGNIGWMTANVPARLHEVAPYWNRVDFGAMYIGGIGVAKDRWDGFSEATKAAFRAGARAYAAGFFKEQAARHEAARATLEANGGQVVVMDPAERAAWIAGMANPVTAWRDAAAARGEPVDRLLAAYRDALAKAGFAFPRDYLAN